MKKILTMLVALLMLVNVSAFCVSAAEDIVLDITFNAEDNSLTVSGTVNSTRDRIPMTLEITKDGSILAAAETLAVGKTDAGVPYQFSPVIPKVTTTSGNLTISVAAAWLNYSASATYNYKGADLQLEALKLIDGAAAAQNAAQMQQQVAATADTLGTAIAEYNALSAKAKTIAAGNLITRRYNLPADCSTEENCLLVRTAAMEYVAQYKEAIALGSFFNLSTGAELRDWYDTHKDTYGFLTDDAETTVDETAMLSYVDTALEAAAYLARRSYMEGAKSMKELNLLMKEQAVLQTAADSNQYVIRNILADFSAALSVDYTAWNALDSNAQSNVCLAVAGKSYNSFAAFSEAVNNAMSPGGGTGSTGSTGSTGGRGNSGSRGSSQVMVSPDMTENIQSNAAYFTDIAHVTWAEEAISYLYVNGIVSGRSEETFAPDDNITRAELAKMLVLGLGYELLADGGRFFDVEAEAWYAQYVETAAAHGLVLGDDLGNFNPNALVTRQDAATILYRALHPEETAEQAYFEDYEAIAAYARIPVDYMCAQGIINGVGDGIFAPLSSLTRAQAAKMLYLTLVQ